MEILFIHQAFPAQFGQLALELTKRYGWHCHFLIEDLSTCPAPSPEMLRTLDVQRLPLSAGFRADPPTPWPQIYARYLELCQAVYTAVQARPELRPDLVVAHGGRGAPTLFLSDLVKCPILNYCEYYFATSHRDISYRIDLPPAEPARFFPRCINAPTLSSLVECAGGYAPTHWQRASFPERFQAKIEVHFDGVDTRLYRPGRATRDDAPRILGGRSLAPGEQLVTFVARGLESMRGFDLFMRAAREVARFRSDTLFCVVGSEQIYYGWDKLHTGQESFKDWVLSQGHYDLSRFVFIPHLEPTVLADLLALSSLHVYLTVPFVLSWSFFDALASGALVLAADVEPVREVIQHERQGLVTPLFDQDLLVEQMLRVLERPGDHAPLRAAARAHLEDKYSLDVCIPELKNYFERMAGGMNSPVLTV